jgi:hypothetical protein
MVDAVKDIKNSKVWDDTLPSLNLVEDTQPPSIRFSAMLKSEM